MVNRLDLANTDDKQPFAQTSLGSPLAPQDGFNQNGATHYRDRPTDPQSPGSGSRMSGETLAQPPKKANITLRNQLLRTLLPLSLTPLAIASVVGYSVVDRNAQEAVKAKLIDQTLLANEAASQLVESGKRIPLAVASNPLIIDSVRASGQKATVAGLSQVPVEELEQRFGSTNLLEVNPTLNAYLLKTIQNEGLAEMHITERHGFVMAYSGKTTDFVQSDEQWWQNGKQFSQWIDNPDIDESANTFAVDFLQAIKDPNTGEFLGLIQSVFPAKRFDELLQLLERAQLVGSEKLQLVDASSSAVINTVTAQGPVNTQEIAGGEVLKGLITELAKAAQDQNLNPDQLSNRLKTDYPLDQIQITPLDQGQGVSVSFNYDGRRYSTSTLPNIDWVAITSIDVAEIRAAGRNLALIFALIALPLAGIAVWLVIWLANQLSKPLNDLSNAARQVSSGNLDVVATPQGTAETQTMAQTFNNLVVRVKASLQEKEIEAEQVRVLADVTGYRTVSEQDLQTVLGETVESIRTLIGVDRLVVYRFQADWSGYIAAESVAAGFPRALSLKIADPCIPEVLLDGYRNDRVVANADIFNTRLHPDHLKLMDRLQIRANLVVPILQQGQLFGLLIAHHCTKLHDWQSNEINFLKQAAGQLGVVVDRVAFIQGREAETERSQLLRDITIDLAQAKSVKEVLTQPPLLKVRQALKADRMIIYRFDKTWKGTITAESVGPGWARSLGVQIHDPCFEKEYVEKYKAGRVQATSNIHTAGLTDCHLRQLEPYEVKANLVVPIKRGEALLGLLIAHQCSNPRGWEKAEIAFLTQVSAQIELALDRCDLLEQRRVAAEQSRMMADEQRQQKESLQRQLVGLLGDVEGAAMGDLTVRAEVTAGEIGTVADFFNSIVESLRQIVTQVKRSALQVNASLGENEGSVRKLADEALHQAEETNRILDSVEQMTVSIQSVAASARQAASVARSASTTAETSGAAMDLTVQNILNLRETVSETAKKVKRLGESSQQISKVVSLINQIALQTNLLSINAGIEAARAGEEGQGFAVVAEEIGALAARSAAATQEIEKIVDNIQMETSQVVEAMEQSTTQVVEGTRLVGEAKQSLGQILDVSRQIDQLVQSISDATVSQVQTSESVSSLMQEIAQISERTSSSSLQISSALRQTVQVAQELQESVGTFKVDAEA